MSIAQAEQRRAEAARVAEATRIADLRARLTTWLHRTVAIDLGEPHAPSVFGRVVAVSGHEVEIIDLSNATVPPDKKPSLRIRIDRIREVRP